MRPKQDCYRKFLLVQNQGLNPGIQSRDPGIGIFQSRNPGIGKEVRDCNPYTCRLSHACTRNTTYLLGIMLFLMAKCLLILYVSLYDETLLF